MAKADEVSVMFTDDRVHMLTPTFADVQVFDSSKRVRTYVGCTNSTPPLQRPPTTIVPAILYFKPIP